LGSYDINPAGCHGILTNVESEADGIAAARAALSGAVDEAIEACRSRQIGGALIELWNNVLAIQCEAATTRVENAVGGLRTAVNLYVAGDEEMAANSQRQVTEVPAITIEDAKK
jgi:hypothetical protein